MKVLAVLPTRGDSKRFPGKFASSICGKPMVYWPYMAAKACEAIDAAVVAVCDDDTQAVCEENGLAWLRTGAHTYGTSRVAEVARRWKFADSRKPDVVINLQADEVMITAGHLCGLLDKVRIDWVDVYTLARTIKPRNAISTNVVKVVTRRDGTAMYFSRSMVPHGSPNYLEHIGVYAFHYDMLQLLVKEKPSWSESMEKLEQLRWLDSGHSIRVMVVSEDDWVSVNTINDVVTAEALLSRRIAGGENKKDLG